MFSKKMFLIILLVFIITALTFVVNISYNYHYDHFSCVGKIEFNKNDKKYFAQVKYIFDGGKGQIYALGEYSQPGQPNKKISQRLLFTYTRKNNEIMMLSKRSLLNDSQSRILNELIPDFYLYKDRGFRIKIFSLQGGGYVFTTYNLPVFICTKIE